MENNKQIVKNSLYSLYSLYSFIFGTTHTQPNQPVTQTERLEIPTEAANSTESQQTAPATPQPILEEEVVNETHPLLADKNQDDSDEGIGIRNYAAENRGLLQPLLPDQPGNSFDKEESEEEDRQIRATENKGSGNTLSQLGAANEAKAGTIKITFPNDTSKSIPLNDVDLIIDWLDYIKQKTFIEEFICNSCRLLLSIAIMASIFIPMRAEIGISSTDFVVLTAFTAPLGTCVCFLLCRTCFKCYKPLNQADRAFLEELGIDATLSLSDEHTSPWDGLRERIEEAQEALHTLRQQTQAILNKLSPAQDTADLVLEQDHRFDLSYLDTAPLERTTYPPLTLTEKKLSENETVIEIKVTRSNQETTSSNTSSLFSHHMINQPAQPLSSSSSSSIQQTRQANNSSQKNSPF